MSIFHKTTNKISIIRQTPYKTWLAHATTAANPPPHKQTTPQPPSAQTASNDSQPNTTYYHHNHHIDITTQTLQQCNRRIVNPIPE